MTKWSQQLNLKRNPKPMVPFTLDTSLFDFMTNKKPHTLTLDCTCLTCARLTALRLVRNITDGHALFALRSLSEGEERQYTTLEQFTITALWFYYLPSTLWPLRVNQHKETSKP